MVLPAMHQVGDDLVSYFETQIKADDINAKDVFQMYTIDALAITSVGVHANTFANPDNVFYDMVSEMPKGPVKDMCGRKNARKKRQRSPTYQMAGQRKKMDWSYHCQVEHCYTRQRSLDRL